MCELLLISHKEITDSQLEKIIGVKSRAWPYSYNSQLDWISTNLKDNDTHVLLSSKDKILAYLNLIEIEVMINGILKMGYGIGNVCASETGKGWGREIMHQTNQFVKETNKIGLLFCKNYLIRFYSLSNWKLIEKHKLRLSFDNDRIETMIFNYESDLYSVEYSGRPF